MEDRLQPNEINLCGQRFHPAVAVFNVGLGLVIGGFIHRWFADGAAWLSPVGLLMLFVGAIWWVAPWWRQRKAA